MVRQTSKNTRLSKYIFKEIFLSVVETNPAQKNVILILELALKTRVKRSKELALPIWWMMGDRDVIDHIVDDDVICRRPVNK